MKFDSNILNLYFCPCLWFIVSSWPVKHGPFLGHLKEEEKCSKVEDALAKLVKTVETAHTVETEETGVIKFLK